MSKAQPAGEAAVESDVVVVGAGPGGSTAAAYLARHGLSVTLLEKSHFPREKVCGDGLTPRATRALTRLGIDTSREAGWIHNYGLRVYGGRTEPFELPWPDLTDFPPHGLQRPRADFDNILAQEAVRSGANLVEGANVDAGILDDRTGRITGVTTKDGRSFTAPIVVAADGNSSRLSVSMGLNKRDDRPMGVAVRTSYTSPRTHDDYLESWLELWDGKPHESTLMPGYGWIFGMGDGTSNVGLGVLNTSKSFGQTDYRALLKRWLDNTPEEWGFRDENMVGKVQGAALPMAFNRQPHYGRGLVLVGDAGGMVNPFNGEGIDYALQAGRVAAECIVQSRSRDAIGAERALASYEVAMKASLGGYYTLGRHFAGLIGHPEIMRLAVKYGLPRTALMRLLLKVMANLTDERGGKAADRAITTLARLTPSA